MKKGAEALGRRHKGSKAQRHKVVVIGKCHCEEPFDKAQDKLRDEAIS